MYKLSASINSNVSHETFLNRDIKIICICMITKMDFIPYNYYKKYMNLILVLCEISFIFIDFICFKFIIIKTCKIY